MIFRFNLHSTLDIITNSSSVEYVSVTENADEVLIQFLQEFVTTAGLDINIKDYITVQVLPDPEWVEVTKNELRRWMEFEGWENITITGDKFTKRQIRAAIKKCDKKIALCRDDLGLHHRVIQVTTKDSDITDELNNLFKMVEGYI